MASITNLYRYNPIATIAVSTGYLGFITSIVAPNPTLRALADQVTLASITVTVGVTTPSAVDRFWQSLGAGNTSEAALVVLSRTLMGSALWLAAPRELVALA